MSRSCTFSSLGACMAVVGQLYFLPRTQDAYCHILELPVFMFCSKFMFVSIYPLRFFENSCVIRHPRPTNRLLLVTSSSSKALWSAPFRKMFESWIVLCIWYESLDVGGGGGSVPRKASSYTGQDSTTQKDADKQQCLSGVQNHDPNVTATA
jgi:hypothetical protein